MASSCSVEQVENHCTQNLSRRGRLESWISLMFRSKPSINCQTCGPDGQKCYFIQVHRMFADRVILKLNYSDIVYKK